MRLAAAVPRSLRGKLLVTVVAAIALVLTALTLIFNLVLNDRLNAEANRILQARASGEVAALRLSGGRIELPESPDGRNPDLQIWVFQGSRPIERPVASPGTDVQAAAVATRSPVTQDLPDSHIRLYALPVEQGGRRIGAVVAALSLGPYVQTAHTALIASVVLALCVLISVAAAARWLIVRALRPVARMTRQASQWSEQDLDRRFALGPGTDELTQLGNTLDALLDRIAVTLRHEQRLSSEISHELRTPLANITAEAQYALRHGSHTEETQATLEHILQSARQLGRTLETLMAAARAQLDPRRSSSDAAACVSAAVAATANPDRSAGPEIAVELPAQPARVAAEQELVERILAPLLENAARYARRLITVQVQADSETIRFLVQDDGPGIGAALEEEIFRPGRRTDASTATAVPIAGAGLGLALSRRLARSAGGDVTAASSSAGGCLTVTLPAA
jgi:signal transduction histidine kinase